MLERWWAVPGFPGYLASDRGQIRGKRGGLLHQRVHGRGGHLVVSIGHRPVLVHRLVLLAFIGEPSEGQECRHLDGDPANNRLTNLVWGTAHENHLDRVRHGVHPQASKTHCKNGHPFDAENTYQRPRGGRGCRVCIREQNRKYALRRRARYTEI